MACADNNCPNLNVIADLRAEVAALQQENEALKQSLKEWSREGSLENSGSKGKTKCSWEKYVQDDKYLAASEALLRGESFLPQVLDMNNPVGKGSNASLGEDFTVPSHNEAEDKVIMGVHSMNILCCAYVYVAESNKYDIVKASGGADRKLCIFDSEGNLLNSHSFDAPIISICALPTFKYVLVGTMSGSVYCAFLKEVDGAIIVDICDQTILKKHELNITCMRISQCHKWLAVASRDRTVNVYQLGSDTSELKHERTLNCAECPESMEFVSNIFGSTCLVVSILGNNYLQYLAVENTFSQFTSDITEKKVILGVGKVEHVNMNDKNDDFVSFNVLDMAAAPMKLPLLAVATDKNRHIIFQTGTTKQVRNLYGHTANEYSRPKLAWHPTGKYLLSTSDTPYSICIWSVCSGMLISSLIGHSASVRGLVINTANLEIMSCSFDKTIRLWKLEDEA